jgi:hypothetical protein
MRAAKNGREYTVGGDTSMSDPARARLIGSVAELTAESEHCHSFTQIDPLVGNQSQQGQGYVSPSDNNGRCLPNRRLEPRSGKATLSLW